MKKTLMAAAAGLLALGGVAHANTALGELWSVPDAVAQNATVANVPATTPDVTFSVATPFNFSGTGVTRSTWLGSSGAFGITENTAGTLAGLMSNGTISTLVEFTGFVSVTNGETFTVTHDDGLTLIIGGLDLGFNAGPTSPTTTTATYTGPTGNFAFTLVYGECCGGPAVLQVDLPFQSVERATPLPGALPLMASGLGGLGLLGWRRKKRKGAALAAA
jgi:hypothetical protein